jgi:hypothetical protein
LPPLNKPGPKGSGSFSSGADDIRFRALRPRRAIPVAAAPEKPRSLWLYQTATLDVATRLSTVSLTVDPVRTEIGSLA